MRSALRRRSPSKLTSKDLGKKVALYKVFNSTNEYVKVEGQEQWPDADDRVESTEDDVDDDAEFDEATKQNTRHNISLYLDDAIKKVDELLINNVQIKNQLNSVKLVRENEKVDDIDIDSSISVLYSLQDAYQNLEDELDNDKRMCF